MNLYDYKVTFHYLTGATITKKIKARSYRDAMDQVCETREFAQSDCKGVYIEREEE